ncbi:membrane hypothetical protein [Sulfurovum sp. enrichment culture clone C5]|uniref:Uncharacterized protein n=1 Tax=Sulfurovum sp. enrichment culture clone C5 TaxID=497650 RepID=A0A0S4XNV0_9BACT|nr:membrane hypothetical protein [Sulfurovum sp. enrichment culture clone C5]
MDIKKILEPSNNIIYRIISIFISSVLFSNVLPIFLFIIYMYKNHFFSYDLFLNGLFGINVFFISTAIFVLIFGLFATSSFVVLVNMITKKYNKKEFFKLSGLFFIFLGLLFLNILFILSMCNLTKDCVDILFLTSISSVVSIHYGVVFFAKPKTSIFSIITSFVIIITLIVNFTKQSSELLATGLRVFNSANKNVEVVNNSDSKISKGKLIFISPDNIYVEIKENNQTKIRTFERKNIYFDTY